MSTNRKENLRRKLYDPRPITPACECGELEHDGPHEMALARREFLESLLANEGSLITLPEGWILSWL